MADNLLANFTEYIENLCRKHVRIKHSLDQKHFIQLNNDEQFLRMNNVYYPLVTIDKLTVTYPGANDSLRKNRYVEMMFLDKINDAGDFKKIQDVKNNTEHIAEEFLKKILTDRKDRINYPFLTNLVISDMELNYVENDSILLYGVLLSFSFEVPFKLCIDTTAFQ